MGFQKADSVQKVKLRRKKERANVGLGVRQMLLTSQHMQQVTEAAMDCFENQDVLPASFSDFSSLRDVLMTKLMIILLRRVMEFAEFRLSEYEMESRGD